MNINDVSSQEVVGDRLVAIFARQEELVKKYQEIEGMPKNYPFNPHTKEGQKWFKDFAWRFTEELAEALEVFETLLSSQKIEDEEFNKHQAHYNEELADALHFLVENLILIGIKPQDLILDYKVEQVSSFDIEDIFLDKETKRPIDLLELIFDQNKGKVPFKGRFELSMKIIVELGKAMNCLKNKPWKQTEMLTDVPKFHGYMVSTFHSFVQLLMASGIDYSTITDLYFRKSEVNKFRQRSKY